MFFCVCVAATQWMPLDLLALVARAGACIPVGLWQLERWFLAGCPPRTPHRQQTKCIPSPKSLCERGLFACCGASTWKAGFRLAHTWTLQRGTQECDLGDPIFSLSICLTMRQHIKKQRHHFANKGPYSQSYGFSSSWIQELDHKEG